MSSLPKRSLLAKAGRVVEVEGWTDEETDMVTMKSLQDGTRRTFIHPSGGSFAALVTGFNPSRTVDEYNRRLRLDACGVEIMVTFDNYPLRNVSELRFRIPASSMIA